MIDVILIFIFGLIVGSFLNCVIYRMSKEESFISGHSYCPKCKHNLYFWDLFPVISYLFLGGKCRYCKEPISCQYPLVELLTASLLTFIYCTLGPVSGFLSYGFFEIVFWWIMTSFFVIIFVFDWKYYLIPDEITYSAIILSIFWIIYSFCARAVSGGELLGFVLSAIGSSLFFFFLWFFSKGKAMGFGDVKLAFLIGLILGWPSILVGLFLAFALGAIIGLALIALKKKGFKSEVPFGPFLVVGTFVTAFFGEMIIKWYLSLS
jgi:prepilin signal peptidase PulO-like enzyme (type II secretory pathway)